MVPRFVYVVLLVFVIVLLTAGCTGPVLKEPVVTIGNISLSDVSLQTMTVNTTVNILNPNPVGAEIRKVSFDVWYLDGTLHYLGHGEQSGFAVKENGNTSVTVPVRIGTVQAAQGVGSLVRNGSLLIRVNGSAVIDLGVTTYEKPFEQDRTFQAGEVSGLLPATIPGTDINVSAGIQQIGGWLGAGS
jgi:LEA14-like dessication related protein